MPIWLRKFTFQKLKEFYDKQNADNNSSIDNAKSSKLKIAHPDIKAAYNTKASSK